MTPVNVVTVLVADDRPLRAHALRASIAASPRFRVVEPERADEHATATVRRARCEVMLVPATAHGIECCREIKESGSSTRVLVLGTDDAPELLVTAIEAGADGYVTTDTTVEDLCEALGNVADGQAMIPPEMLGSLLRTLIERRREHSAAMERYLRLSERERQVLSLLVSGLDKDEIAKELVISAHTSRTHIQNVLTKLEVHSRLEAVALAADLDLPDEVPPLSGGQERA